LQIDDVQNLTITTMISRETTITHSHCRIDHRCKSQWQQLNPAIHFEVGMDDSSRLATRAAVGWQPLTARTEPSRRAGPLIKARRA